MLAHAPVLVFSQNPFQCQEAARAARLPHPEGRLLAQLERLPRSQEAFERRVGAGVCMERDRHRHRTVQTLAAVAAVLRLSDESREPGNALGRRHVLEPDERQATGVERAVLREGAHASDSGCLHPQQDAHPAARLERSGRVVARRAGEPVPLLELTPATTAAGPVRGPAARRVVALRRHGPADPGRARPRPDLGLQGGRQPRGGRAALDAGVVDSLRRGESGRRERQGGGDDGGRSHGLALHWFRISSMKAVASFECMLARWDTAFFLSSGSFSVLAISISACALPETKRAPSAASRMRLSLSVL